MCCSRGCPLKASRRISFVQNAELIAGQDRQMMLLVLEHLLWPPSYFQVQFTLLLSLGLTVTDGHLDQGQTLPRPQLGPTSQESPDPATPTFWLDWLWRNPGRPCMCVASGLELQLSCDLSCTNNNGFYLRFRGGAELLFDGVKKHRVTLPSQPEPCEYLRVVAVFLLTPPPPQSKKPQPRLIGPNAK